MTISSEITKLQNNLSDSYTACQGKGATMPADENFDNLADCIDSIQTGSTPVISSLNVTPTTSAQTITAPSGTDGYSPVNVSAVTSSIDNNITAGNIKSGVSILGVTGTYEGESSSKYGATIDNIFGNVNNSGAYLAPAGQLNLVFSGIKTFGGTSYGSLDYRFRNMQNVISVSFPDLEDDSITDCLSHTFERCTNLTTASFPKLNSLVNWTPFQYCFNGCTSLTSATFPLLTSITAQQAFYYCFKGCSALTTVDFSELVQIGTNSSSANHGHFAYAFDNCNNLTTLTFPKLEKIYCTGGSTASNGTFAYNSKVEKMYFPKLDTISYGSGAISTHKKACKQIFANCSSLTELHFGAANQSAIQATDGYSTLWGRGAGLATVYFDL